MDESTQFVFEEMSIPDSELDSYSAKDLAAALHVSKEFKGMLLTQRQRNMLIVLAKAAAERFEMSNVPWCIVHNEPISGLRGSLPACHVGREPEAFAHNQCYSVSGVMFHKKTFPENSMT